jgi:hypothetical protein
MLKEGGYPSKMLMCSVRTGPLVNGKMRYWDVEEISGGDIVYTLPPSALEPMFQLGDALEFRETAIEEEIPESTLEKIYQMPFTMQAYEPNGLSLDQFNTHPSTIFTVAEFSRPSRRGGLLQGPDGEGRNQGGVERRGLSLPQDPDRGAPRGAPLFHAPPMPAEGLRRTRSGLRAPRWVTDDDREENAVHARAGDDVGGGEGRPAAAGYPASSAGLRAVRPPHPPVSAAVVGRRRRDDGRGRQRVGDGGQQTALFDRAAGRGGAAADQR